MNKTILTIIIVVSVFILLEILNNKIAWVYAGIFAIGFIIYLCGKSEGG